MPDRTRAALARSADLLARAAVTVGVVGLLFVAHEQWVTGWRHDRAQAHLRAALAAVPSSQAVPGSPAPSDAPADAPDDAPDDSPADAPDAPGTVTAALDVPTDVVGAPVAVLRIPAIGVETVVVEGASVATLREAPGRIGSSAPLGATGATVIAGHRTTWGAPFGELDRLRPGDAVLVTRGEVTWRYRVTGTRVSTPRDAEVLAPAATRTLRLVTCHPRFSAARRLVVEAVAADSRGPADTPSRPSAPPAAGGSTGLPSGLEPSAAASAALLPGAVAVAVWLLGGLLAHGRRMPARLGWRLAALAGAAVPLVVAFDRLDSALHA